MSKWHAYKLRWRRRRILWQAFRARRQLKSVVNRTQNITPSDILVVCTLRNERIRLPYFLQYYRDLGVSHFLFIENDSDDGSSEYLKEQPDVSLWSTKHSYKAANFGVKWMNWISRKYCHNHWTLTVDVDEFFVFPFSDTRNIRALTEWLDQSNTRSFAAMMLDMYPKGKLTDQPYSEGQNPFEIAEWFDSGNYMISRNWDLWNLWIQGGPRARLFFHENPEQAPSLNKIPLIKWDRSYAYVQSTHMALPRKLNLVYETNGGERASGVLLHAKFLDCFLPKASEEMTRQEHYEGGREYAAYHQTLSEHPEIWCNWSEKYINWRQLEILGLMSQGDWS